MNRQYLLLPIVDAFFQEGLKQHEGGQNQPNPFDVFSNFFGGRRYHVDCREHVH